ncbi:MAG: hypothetical protein HPY57_14130 [Ignavibacteria bacterium]|nr:hypothetical protein [Ignavibacteria bacterium]
MKYLKYIEDWNIYVTKKFQSISEELSEEQLINYIKENCKEFLKKPKVITRSIRPDNLGKDWIDFDYFYSDPKTLNRKSSDCYNYYTLIIDNAPEWKDYPKRSKSFICTLGTSHIEGNRYYVIPKDDSKWGVCKKHDIFVSFDDLKYDAGQFTRDLYNFYYVIMGNKNDVLNDDDYNEFMTKLNNLNTKLKKMKWEKVKELIKKNNIYHDNLLKY